MKFGVAVGIVALGMAVMGACSTEVTTNNDAGGGGAGAGDAGGGGNGGNTGGTGGVPGPSTSNKLDLLIVVDNSRSMADKQRVLSDSLPTLVSGLVEAGVSDMHVGVISSSLGGQGADVCNTNPEENDRGQLVTRDGEGGVAPTFQDQGFLAWNPSDSEITPPGEADGGALGAAARVIIEGVGQTGCGYESPLESMYRFLIEPDPYESIAVVNNQAEPQGTDTVLLQQRANFVRPDSMLLVVVLSDENDCSTRDNGQYFFVRQVYEPGSNAPYHLPAARAACAVDPADPCCRSCGQTPGPGCSTDNDQCDAPLSALEDNINLRCFDQKRRFGIDFLWPSDRYTTGLNSAEVPDRFGNVVANPLYASGQRGSELVTLTTIVGAPWQLTHITDQAGTRAARASDIDAAGWAALIGDPSSYTPPTDPHMVESVEPRPGLAPPDSAAGADPIHGHEFSVPGRDDLQYACTFPLPEARDCNTEPSCDCPLDTDRPICDGSTQIGAKSYPGIRQLEVARALGHRAVAGSVCPIQQGDPAASDFGYNPIFRTVLEVVDERVE